MMGNEMVAAAQREAAKQDDAPADNEQNRRVCDKCPVCKIEIGATEIGRFGRHTFLLYTFYEGDVERKRFFRYGPDGDDPYPADTSKVDGDGEPEWTYNKNYEVMKYTKAWSFRQDGVPDLTDMFWGRIRGVHGEWEGSYEQAMWAELGAPLVELAKGSEWCGKYLQLVQIMRAIIDRGKYYDATRMNCNSATNTMLRRLNLPFNMPDDGWYPARDVDILK